LDTHDGIGLRRSGAAADYGANSALDSAPSVGTMPPTPGSAALFLVLDLDQTLITDLDLDAALALLQAGESRTFVSWSEKLAAFSLATNIAAAAVAAPSSECIADLMFMRPGLEAFLEHVLDRFAGVAIWTKAGPAWLSLALATPPLSKFCNRFAFTWDGGRCTKVRPFGAVGGGCSDASDGMYVPPACLHEETQEGLGLEAAAGCRLEAHEHPDRG